MNPVNQSLTLIPPNQPNEVYDFENFEIWSNIANKVNRVIDILNLAITSKTLKSAVTNSEIGRFRLYHHILFQKILKILKESEAVIPKESIAKMQAKISHYVDALKTVDSIYSTNERFSSIQPFLKPMLVQHVKNQALNAIVEAIFVNGDFNKCFKAFQERVELRNKLIIYAAKAKAISGNYKEASEIAKNIKSSIAKSEAFKEIAKAQMHNGDYSEAFKNTLNIKYEPERRKVLETIKREASNFLECKAINNKFTDSIDAAHKQDTKLEQMINRIGKQRIDPALFEDVSLMINTLSDPLKKLALLDSTYDNIQRTTMSKF